MNAKIDCGYEPANDENLVKSVNDHIADNDDYKSFKAMCYYSFILLTILIVSILTFNVLAVT